MDRIFSDMNNILSKFKNISKLGNNKLGYFFSDNEYDTISINNSESIRTYPIAAYADHLQCKFNAIFKSDNSILIDKSNEIEIINDSTNMYVIYANYHNINKTVIKLSTDVNIVSKSRINYSDINKIFNNESKLKIFLSFLTPYAIIAIIPLFIKLI